ncbi:Type III restriction enzyme, res subunit [Bacteroidales bacterium WCE2008]|nr:Type III restriction enzyme, res subunit [Bacteroidales bacterium WCE2008]
MAETNTPGCRFNTAILDNIIVGRVDPSIYAFSTETVPNYLKVGDTYRPVETRLDEWRKYFPNLRKEYQDSARIDDNTLFRDFAVHSFLTDVRKRARLKQEDVPGIPYYSKEFFRDATIEDVKDAINDIHRSADDNDGRYTFYNTDYLPVIRTYDRVEDYEPRPNQDTAIKNFHAAVEKGRNNLLLYAVMRFGKSFTSMCCALDAKAKYVIIVSAKADVKEEWKKTVESHVLFSEYIFADAESLDRNDNLISSTLSNNKRIVLFLTLQDLQGDEIKKRHTEVFHLQSDLLIVDETHFGARAERYGRVLESFGLMKAEAAVETAGRFGDFVKEEDEEAIKQLDSKVRIHLSGTPYRILMSGEFTKEDIIAFCQFSDIVEEQRKWDDEHLLSDDDGTNKDVKEWDNPYYGFPQMVRFAFNPNESSRKRIEQLRSEGRSASIADLLRPVSIQKTNDGAHKKFVYEHEVLDLLSVIDGSKEDENILGFLNYDRIKRGKMCRHIVCVLPFRASCDALEALIKENISIFKNLSTYEIINIAGVDNETLYPDTSSVKSRIVELESNGKKTITLTVNRMLTGSTVEQWDTMLYLKNSSSPQEYDQAIFRLQNQYIQTYKSEGSEEVIKFNMKPQTLLVDFDPVRMFELQERRSQFYNVNTDKKGNLKLEERLAKELEISPIIVINKDKLEEVTPSNILDAVREYSKERSVLDEAWDIPIDFGLLSDEGIMNAIKDLNPIDSSKGLEFKPNEGDGDDFDAEDDEEGEGSGKVPSNKNSNSSNNDNLEQDSEDSDLKKKLCTYYSMILFFAFLTKSDVKSLDDIINTLHNGKTYLQEDRRIANSLGIKLSVLRIIQTRMNPFYLSKLDYKIQNINSLMKDSSLPPLERAERAMKKFGRLSTSEIVTPSFLACDIVGILPFEPYNSERILDIASKQGEFACALYKRFGVKAKDSIISLPTSRVSYELTRKIYELLSLPVENVIDSFVTYDLLSSPEKKEKLINMKFDAVVGNPPYQVTQATTNASFASAIYPIFMDIAFDLGANYISLITPSRWMTKQGQGVSERWADEKIRCNHFQIINDYLSASDCFPSNVEIKGGVNYFLYNGTYSGPCKYFLHQNGKVYLREEELNSLGTGVVIRDMNAPAILRRIIDKEGNFFVDNNFSSYVGPVHFFDKAGVLGSKWKGYSLRKSKKRNIKFYTNKQLEPQGFGWIKLADLPKGAQSVNIHKIYIPEAGGSGTDPYVLGKPFYGEPGSVCSQTYLVIGYDPVSHNLTKVQCDNIISYIRTKFFRYLVSIMKNTQHNPSSVFQFVPVQDFSKPWTDEELYAKYELTKDEISVIEATIKPLD